MRDIARDDGGAGGFALHETGVLWPENMFGSVYDDWEAVLDIRDLVPTSCYVSFMLVKFMNFCRLTPDLPQRASRCS